MCKLFGKISKKGLVWVLGSVAAATVAGVAAYKLLGDDECPCGADHIDPDDIPEYDEFASLANEDTHSAAFDKFDIGK